LNEAQYRAVCEICDRILLASDSTTERVAITWLHIVREHPIFLKRYEDLFEIARGAKAIVNSCLRIGRNKAAMIRQIGRSLFSDGEPWYGRTQLQSPIDILFISHLLNPSQSGKEDDFYYGGLPIEMAARGYSAVIALINHTGQSAGCLAGKWNESSVPRVILSSSIRFLEEIALRRRLKIESVRLKKLANTTHPELTRRVLTRASEESLANSSLTNLRIGSQIGALVAKLKPAAIVVTHEGHAWERMVFAAARCASPSTLCIAYQHSALFHLQHAIRRNLEQEYNPDQIMTAGAVSKAQLGSAPGLNGIPISVLGSNRSWAGNGADTNGKRQVNLKQLKGSNQSACLVLPEGINSECYHLFEFSQECAKVCPEIQFIWRLHPLVTFESLLARNTNLKDLPKNIILSQATLEEDIDRCRWALYRGTTAIVKAVGAGLRPIYLQLPGELSIDPLYEVKGWRVSVKTVEDFQGVTSCDLDGLLIDSDPEFSSAKRYCEDFFRPLNPKTLEVAIFS